MQDLDKGMQDSTTNWRCVCMYSGQQQRQAGPGQRKEEAAANTIEHRAKIKKEKETRPPRHSGRPPPSSVLKNGEAQATTQNPLYFWSQLRA